MKALHAPDADNATLGVLQEGTSLTVRRSAHPLATFTIKRVAAGILTLFFASMFIFLATQALPGNVAEVVLGRNASPENLAVAEARLGLDRSLASRYGDWIEGMVKGDLGDSSVAIAQGAPSAPIQEEIGEPLRNSLILAGIVILLMVPLSIAGSSQLRV